VRARITELAGIDFLATRKLVCGTEETFAMLDSTAQRDLPCLITLNSAISFRACFAFAQLDPSQKVDDEASKQKTEAYIKHQDGTGNSGSIINHAA